MGYGPHDTLQTTLNVVDLNVTYLLAVSPPGQLCPLAAWAAYWTLRTHGIPVDRWENGAAGSSDGWTQTWRVHCVRYTGGGPQLSVH
jgi:hypothetical protein